MEVKAPSVEVECEVKAPSAECEAEVRAPSVEFEFQVKVPSAECEVEVEVKAPTNEDADWLEVLGVMKAVQVRGQGQLGQSRAAYAAVGRGG